MSVALIIVGFLIARFGALLFVAGESQGGQGLGSGIVTLIIQVGGWALVLWGIIRLFT